MSAMGCLSESDLRRFATEGYLVVPAVIDNSLLEAADPEIDAVTVELPPVEGDRGPGANLWFPPVGRLPSCDKMLRCSPALRIAEELVSPLELEHAFDHIQIATTVPGWSHKPGGPHIDGHGPGQDPPASFTLLAGIFMTDQRSSQSGNLWVWPGSHLDHQRLFHQRGTKVLQQTGGHCTLLDPPLELSEPVEITANRGDLLLAHYLLGHNKGGNISTHVRRTVYYRLSVPGHTDHWEPTFLDPWTEYEPVHRARDNAPTDSNTDISAEI
jgi:Phytanoyl-CoA dioxygenase (PhyH)